MKKILTAISGLLIFLLWGCASDELGGGKGKVIFDFQINSDVKIQSRAKENWSEKAEITIYNSHGAIRKYQGLDQLPIQGLWLPTGGYKVSVCAGDSVPASWDSRYFKGLQPFEVRKDETQKVSVNCKIANTAISVKYDPELKFKELTIEAGIQAGSLTWKDFETRRGYFMLSQPDENIKYTISGINANGIRFEHTGVIPSPKQGYEYILNIKPSPTPQGSLNSFIIEVDSRMMEINDQMVISMPPEIKGTDFDISQPLTGTKGSFPSKFIVITGCTGLSSASITKEDGNVTDLLKGTPEDFHPFYTYDKDIDMSVLLVEISPDYLNGLNEGEYELLINAEDTKGLKSSSTLKIIVSSQPVVLNPVNEEDIWATKALLTGNLVKKDITEVNFEYKKESEVTWTNIKGNVSNSAVIAQISGLLPDTKYNYRVSCEGYISETLSFTTEKALQLPNSGFEEWQTDKTPFLVYKSGDEMFWDSGNHGSKLLNKNITTPDTEIKHSGSQSAKLASQFVGISTFGKFAAGNLFSGKYLETLGTDGVLGFGRPFTSRPVAIKGYIKYRRGVIAYENSECPDATLKKGNPDKGIIYIAILDDYKETRKEYEFPFIVNTRASERHLFDSNGAHVIAYGEQIFTEDTPGEGMIEFTIPLNYHNTSLKAFNIMIVAAASKGGDYFVGGNSTMWLDDLELVY